MPFFTFFDFDVLTLLAFLPVLMPLYMGCPPSRKTSKPSGACLGPYEHLPDTKLLTFSVPSSLPFLRFSGFLKRNGFEDFPEIRIFRGGNRWPFPGWSEILVGQNLISMLTDFQCN
jgi:hypothetical protein